MDDIYCVLVADEFLFVGKNARPFGFKLSTKSGAVIQSLDGHSGPITTFFLSEDLLFSGSEDSTIICRSIVNDEIIRTYVGHSDMVFSVVVYDGELYSTASGAEFFKWKIDDGSIEKKFPSVHLHDIKCLAYRSPFLFT